MNRITNDEKKEMTNKEAIEYFEYTIELEDDPNPAIVKAIQALKIVEEIKEILSKKDHLEFEDDELNPKDGSDGGKLTNEEKSILVDTANVAFDVLNRAVKNKDMSLANVSLDAINGTIRLMNKVKHEEVKN